MANRRMFSMKIVDTDAFLDMPQSSQLLYFHLAMRADDDGFVSNPKKVMRGIGSNDDDYKLLIAKKFLIIFESGVCVIKHWLIHNLVRADRYTETQYVREKAMLVIHEETKKYSLNKGKNHVIPDGNHSQPQVRLGKVRLGKIREEPSPLKKSQNYLNALPEEDIREFTTRFEVSSRQLKSKAESLYLYCESKGKRYKNYRSFLLNAIKKDFPERKIEKKEEVMEPELTDDQRRVIEQKKEEIRRKFSVR